MDVNQLLNRFAEAQKMMKQMGGMMGLPGGWRRKATKSPKNKRKGTQGRPPPGGAGRRPAAACPAGCPRLPPGFDPTALAAAPACRPASSYPSSTSTSSPSARTTDPAHVAMDSLGDGSCWTDGRPCRVGGTVRGTHVPT